MLQRLSRQQGVTVATAVADSEEILFGNYSMGMVHVPSGSTITQLTWYDAPVRGGTYLTSYDADGVAVTQTVVAARSYPIPLALAGAVALKIVGDAEGSVDVTLKG